MLLHSKTLFLVLVAHFAVALSSCSVIETVDRGLKKGKDDRHKHGDNVFKHGKSVKSSKKNGGTVVTNTKAPTKSPTKEPTKEPTKSPTIAPTKEPTKEPTKAPTVQPIPNPSPSPVPRPPTPVAGDTDAPTFTYIPTATFSPSVTFKPSSD